MLLLHWGRSSSVHHCVPDSDPQLYHGVFDRRATSSHEIAEELRIRDERYADSGMRGPGGGHTVPARASAVPLPAAAGGSVSVVHEVTLIQDLRAGTHQGRQVLVGVVAAEE